MCKRQNIIQEIQEKRRVRESERATERK